jgi:hypothetical protein
LAARVFSSALPSATPLVDFSGIAGGGKDAAVGQGEKIEDRICGQRDARDIFPGLHDVQCRGGRGADEQIAVGEREHGDGLRLGHVGDFVDRVRVVFGIERHFLHPAFGPGADEEAV